MKFYLGGYYLVKINKNDTETIPETIYTVTNCINILIPSLNGLKWVTSSSHDNKKIMDSIDIDENGFLLLQEWVSEKFDESEFTISGSFNRINIVKEFIKKFVIKKDNLKLLAIYLPEEYYSNFIDDNYEEGTQSDREISSVIKLKIEEDNLGSTIGFDLLGYEIGGDFHSFHCHNLKSELIEKLKINFNQYELIANYQDAKKALGYINIEGNAEPVRWDIWKVKEFNY